MITSQSNTDTQDNNDSTKNNVANNEAKQRARSHSDASATADLVERKGRIKNNVTNKEAKQRARSHSDALASATADLVETKGRIKKQQIPLLSHVVSVFASTRCGPAHPISLCHADSTLYALPCPAVRESLCVHVSVFLYVCVCVCVCAGVLGNCSYLASFHRKTAAERIHIM